MGNKEVQEAMKHPDKLGAGAEKRRHLNPEDKIHAVMSEYKRGTLNSGSGQRASSRAQAVAIAMSETGKSYKHPKGHGGAGASPCKFLKREG